MNDPIFRNHLDTAIRQLKKGISVSKVNARLRENKVSKSKTKQLIELAKKTVEKQLAYKIKESLSKREAIPDQLGLDAGFYNELRIKQEGYLEYNLMVNIKAQVIAYKSNSEIINSLSGSYLSKEQIIEAVDKERRAISKKINGERMGYLLLGSVILAAGIFFISTTDIIHYTLLLVGGSILFKGFRLDPNEIYDASKEKEF